MMRLLGFIFGIALISGLFYYYQDSILGTRRIEPIAKAPSKAVGPPHEETRAKMETDKGRTKLQKPAINPVDPLTAKKGEPDKKVMEELADLSVRVPEDNLFKIKEKQQTDPPIAAHFPIFGDEQAIKNPPKPIGKKIQPIPKPKPKPPQPPIGSIATPEKNETGLFENTVQWAPFWRPFNSRRSAQGFADNLTKRTELDLKVSRNSRGRFVVSYPYRSEEERQAIAETIKEKTGLEVNRR